MHCIATLARHTSVCCAAAAAAAVVVVAVGPVAVVAAQSRSLGCHRPHPTAGSRSQTVRPQHKRTRSSESQRARPTRGQRWVGLTLSRAAA